MDVEYSPTFVTKTKRIHTNILYTVHQNSAHLLLDQIFKLIYLRGSEIKLSKRDIPNKIKKKNRVGVLQIKMEYE